MDASMSLVPVDTLLKDQAERVLKEAGLSLQSAFTALMEAVVKNGEMPLLEDPFYTEENLRGLERCLADVLEGKDEVFRTSFEELEAWINE